MTAQNDPYKPGLEIVPGYTLIKPLGGGMSGDVWVARAAGGTDVALKIVRSLSLVGGRKEFAALRTIRNVRHPNLCPVHGFWTKAPDGRLLEDGETEAMNPESTDLEYNPTKSAGQNQPTTGTMAIGATADQNLVGEENDGPAPESTEIAGSKQPKAEQLIVVMGLGDCTLYDRLQQVREESGLAKQSTEVNLGLSPAETVKYLRAAAGAIDLLNQEHDIYHCDIKPQNILLVGGEAQVCDFGLAHKIVGDMRQTKQAFASPAYAAPEVLQGRTYSRSVDQYSLAITYFELRTGLLPFDITTEANITLAKCTGKLNLATVTPPERKVLRRAMQINPQHRYPSCSDFVDAMAIATGVDKRGGLTLSRIAIAAVVLLLITGASIFGWKTYHPSSYQAVFSSGITAAELYENAAANVDEFHETASPDFLLGHAPLREAIDTIQIAAPMADPGLRERLRLLAIDASKELDRAISALLDEGELKNTEGFVREDIQRISSLFQGDEPILSPEKSESLQLQTASWLHQLQLSHLTETDSHDPGVVDAAKDLRRMLREPSKAFRSRDQELLASVVVALTHANAKSNQNQNQFISDPAFEDIVVAQRIINERGMNSLPNFYKQRWIDIRDSEHGILSQLKIAFVDSKTDDWIIQQINQTWPSLSMTSRLNDLKQFAKKRQWNEFAETLSALKTQTEPMEDEESVAKLEVFVSMQDSLDQPKQSVSRIVAFEQLFKSDRLSMKVYFRSTIERWLDELSNRLLSDAVPLTIDEAVAYYAEASRLCATLNSDNVPAVDAVLRTSWLAQPWNEFLSDELGDQLKASSKQDASASFRWIASAVELEFSARVGIRLPRQKLNESRRAIETLSDRSTLPAAIGSNQIDFVEALLVWHAGKSAEAANRWEEMSGLGKTKQALGSERCQWIASELLGLACAESGVSNTDLLSRRYEDSSQGVIRVQQASQWLSGLENADECRFRLEEHELQFSMAELQNAGKSFAGVEVPKQMLQIVRQSLGQANPDASLGQVFRTISDLANAQCKAQQGGKLTKKYAEDLNLLMDSTVAVLDLGIGDRIRDSAWIEHILDPTMTSLRPWISQTDGGSDVWIFSGSIDQDSPRRFLRHYLKTAGNPRAMLYFSSKERDGNNANRSKDYRWNEALEIASSISASEPNLSSDVRGTLWVDAAEFLQLRHDSTKEIWDEDTLKLLDRYLGLADQIKPGDPDVAVLRAFRRYYEASLKTTYRDKVTSLKQATKELSDAIEILEELGPSVSLYNAYWRHANTLVSLAFTEAGKTRSEHLKVGRKHAITAIELIENPAVQGKVVEHAAYQSLGNCCEDLAHYCSETGSKIQRQYFAEAIEAFQQAAALTEFSNPMKQRYALARCQFRYWESGASATGLLGTGLLEKALDDLGEFREDASPHIQREWLGWRSKILIGLGRKDDAIVDAKRAYELLQSSSVTDQQRGEIQYHYASCLQGEDVDDCRLALSILQTDTASASFTTYWKNLTLQCILLSTLGQHSEMLELVESIPEERFAEIRQDPHAISQKLASISLYVRHAGFPEHLGGSGVIDQVKARESLNRIVQELSKHKGSFEENAAAEWYLGFISVNAESLSQRPLAGRVEAYLDSLPAGNEDGLDQSLVDQVRLAMLDQFVQVLRDYSRSAEAKRILAEAKPVIIGEKSSDLRNQLLLIQQANMDLSGNQNAAIRVLLKMR